MLEQQPVSSEEFAELRRLLMGPEQRQLEELTQRVNAALNPAGLAQHLPQAVAFSTSRDRQLGRALAPTIETALRESIRRNPREIATAIFPVLGPAIRKAIAETMAGLVRSINSAVEHSLSVRGLRWRIEAWRTGVPYAEIVIKHALLYRVEQVFLIHAESGLLIAHVTAPGLNVADADLISGMLTAIQDFVRDSFRPAEGGSLSTFTVGEHTVHVESGPRALIAAVIRGQSPETVTQRLQTTLEQIHLEFASQLAEFKGDAAPFEAARPLLEENLETVLSTDRPAQPSRLDSVRWAAPLLLLVFIAAGLLLQSRLRWQRAVRALETEPGFVVVDASRGWSEWRFRGLKDPLARDAHVVLSAAGFASPTVAARWEPYLSLDSVMVVARARRSLAVPASATIALLVDTLVLGGEAPIAWLRDVRNAAVPPGVSRLDVSSVVVMLPPSLEALKRAVEVERVLFEPGSAGLTDASAARLPAVAASFRRLADSVISAGASIGLELVGRTDVTGSDQANQALAQWRIDGVTRRLISAGIGADRIAGQPVATSQPLRVPSADEQARINRSVSFNVIVGTGPWAPRRQ